MMLMLIILSDTHFSDKQKDEYRFDIFKWLVKACIEYKPWALFILGDITEQKDKHSSKLVNRIIEGLTEVLENVPKIYILMGNHDRIDVNTPFFKFINSIEDLHFIIEPTLIKGESKCLMIPHCIKEWPDLSKFKNVDYIFIHQTVEGAIAESGARLTGLPQGQLVALQPRKIISGDIHRPQVCGAVVYAGSPYNIRFGDNFKPRILLLDDHFNQLINLHFKCPRKYVLKIRDIAEIRNNTKLKKGDHVKIEIELSREELVEWPNYKRDAIEACKERGLETFGVKLFSKKQTKKRFRIKEHKSKDLPKTNIEIFKRFCNHENLSSIVRQVGKELLE